MPLEGHLKVILRSLQFPFPEISWKPYDPTIRALPDGFVLGTHKDGSRIFVGRGPEDNMIFPGRLHNARRRRDRALFLPLNPEREITENIEYLSVFGNCNCRFRTCEDASCATWTDTVSYYSNPFIFWISKETVTTNETSYDAIGGYVPFLDFSIYTGDDGSQQSGRSPFEILVCDKTPDN